MGGERLPAACWGGGERLLVGRYSLGLEVADLRPELGVPRPAFSGPVTLDSDVPASALAVYAHPDDPPELRRQRGWRQVRGGVP
jgi:hypothetical protein